MGRKKQKHRKDLHCRFAFKCFRSKEDCKTQTGFYNRTPPECLLPEEQLIKENAYRRYCGRAMKDDGVHTYYFRKGRTPSLTKRERKKCEKKK